MGATDGVNYEAVLADLEAKKAEIERAIATIRAVMGIQSAGGDPIPPGPRGGGPTPQPGAFLGMSIPEAAKKYLQTSRTKSSTKDIMAALEAGGLPPSKYATVYGVLRRREEMVGDIVNMSGDWALAEWYPNHPRVKSKSSKTETTDNKDKSEEKPQDLKAEKKDHKAAGN
jgi:hypothetical protein